MSAKIPEVVSTGVKLITPEEAAEMAGWGFEEQRRTDPRRVKLYAAQMTNGEWGLADADIVIATIKGRKSGQKYLIAGNHRIAAVIESDTPQRFKVSHYEYLSYTDMVADYFRTNKGKPITQAQALVGLHTSEALGVNSKITRTAATALRIIGSELDRPGDKAFQVTSDFNTLNGLLHNWQPQIKAYDNALRHAYKRQIDWFIRGPVMAVGLLTFRYKPEIAEAFWRTVALGADLPLNSPEYKMRDLLSNPSRSWSDSTKTREQVVLVSRPWNAYFEGRTLDKLTGNYKRQKGQFSMLTPRVAGTPFSGTANVDGLQIIGIKG